MSQPRSGDLVRIQRGCAPYYQTDTYATLTREHIGGQGWWADFNHPGNLTGAYSIKNDVAEWFVPSSHMVRI